MSLAEQVAQIIASLEAGEPIDVHGTLGPDVRRALRVELAGRGYADA